MAPPVLAVSDLQKHFPASPGLFGSRAVVRAVDGVSFGIEAGETLGLVGESGSGKSTVARCVLRLLTPTDGRVLLRGTDITRMSRRALRPWRRHMHMVFQDPYGSLDPRMRVGQIVAAPLRHHGIADRDGARQRVATLLARVGLGPEHRDRYPHQLAGGQRQRVAIARALVLQPALLVLDEPLSALDASIQAAVINLMVDLQQEMGFASLFVTHDLSAAEYLCDRIAVMYLGRIVELAPRRALFARPTHPYTQALLAAVPVPDPRVRGGRARIVLGGAVPSLLESPPGCAFHPRCPVVIPRCRTEMPALVAVGPDGHQASCHRIGPDGEPPVLVARTPGD